jgi:hypothetical protein
MGRTHPNLVGHWRFENNLLDTSGNGNNGTVAAGTPSYIRGRIGQAWDNFVSNTYIKLGSTGKITGPLTVSGWINPPAPVLAGRGIVTRRGAAGERSWAMNYSITGLFQAFISANGTDEILLESAVLPVNTWSHLAMTYEPSVRFAQYVNGVMVNELTSGVPAALFDTGYETRIGTHTDENVARYFRGYIDDVQIWHRALQPHHIRAIYNGVDPAFIGDVA